MVFAEAGASWNGLSAAFNIRTGSRQIMTATCKRLTLRLIGILAVGLLLRLCLNQKRTQPFSQPMKRVPTMSKEGPHPCLRVFGGDRVGLPTLQGTGMSCIISER